MAARRSITCMCICSAGGRSGPWFREHRYPEKRNRDEEENRRAGQITRHAAAAYPEAHGGKKETPGQRGKILGTFRQGTRHRTPRAVSRARALSPWLPARLGRPRNILRR